MREKALHYGVRVHDLCIIRGLKLIHKQHFNVLCKQKGPLYDGSEDQFNFFCAIFLRFGPIKALLDKYVFISC